jgi:hypothetical protein
MHPSRKLSWSILNSSILLLALAMAAAGCKGNSKAQGHAAEAAATVASASGEDLQSLTPAIEGRKIVYTGALSLRVPSYDKARAEIERVLQSTGGYIARGETEGHGDLRYATLTLRLPTAQFAAVRTQLQGLGEVESETIAADDVTEQHVDLSARLANARKFEARLLELVSAKTDSVADLLVVEAELGRVREQIERLDAQRRNMDDQISMATLTLSIYSEQSKVAALALGDRMSGALQNSYTALGQSGAVLMVALSALLPWALVFALLAFLLQRLRGVLAKRKVAIARQV